MIIRTLIKLVCWYYLIYFAWIMIALLLEFGDETFFECVRRISSKYRKFQGKYVDVSGGDMIREEYDFVIIGAGTAGSVVANRLSEEKKWKVLLLEAGNYESFLTDIPVLSIFNHITGYSWGCSTEPQAYACWAMEGRRCKWPQGKAVGGTSVINHMIYARGSSLDYDTWARLGNQGWSYDEVLPYFLKSENNQIPALKSSDYHSSGGYLNVESVPFRTPLARAFLEGAEELGYSVGDYNGEDQLVFSFIQATMREGSRCSAAKAFLQPIQQRTNLHTSINSRVTKIIIDPITKLTTGVEFFKDRVSYTAKVKKEVILTAGAINSPQILILSGVGPKDHLLELGIKLIQDLKVGLNLQDNISFMGLTFVLNDTVGLDVDSLMSPLTLGEYLLNGTGMFTLPVRVEALGFIRTKYSQDSRPDVALVFASSGHNNDIRGMNKEANGMIIDFYDKLYKTIKTKNTWSIIPFLILPKSKGSVQLRDKDPFQCPVLKPNYFSDPNDIDSLIEAIKYALKIADTQPFKKYNSHLSKIHVPGCEDHSFGSDAYWACAIKYLSYPSHHQTGTCKMGPATDLNAVVDPGLRVFGIKGLRVADTSIIPTIPTAHTAAVAYMIGEKVSDLIKDEWDS